MSKKFSKFQTVSGGRTMWQIVWTGEEVDDHDGEVTLVDASNLEFNTEDTEEVVWDRTSTNASHKAPPRLDPLTGVEMQPEESRDREFTGHNLLLRRDSDTDLILKTSKAWEWGARMRYCWLNCRNPVFWRTYWWLPLVIVGACAMYVGVVLTIVYTMGDD